MSKRRRVLIFDSVLDNIFNSREWLPGTRFFCNYKTFNNPHKAGDVRQLHAHLHSGPHAFLKDRDAAEVVAVVDAVDSSLLVVEDVALLHHLLLSGPSLE